MNKITNVLLFFLTKVNNFTQSIKKSYNRIVDYSVKIKLRKFDKDFFKTVEEDTFFMK